MDEMTVTLNHLMSVVKELTKSKSVIIGLEEAPNAYIHLGENGKFQTVNCGTAVYERIFSRTNQLKENQTYIADHADLIELHETVPVTLKNSRGSQTCIGKMLIEKPQMHLDSIPYIAECMARAIMNAQKCCHLRNDMAIDPMTGLLNRYGMEQRLTAEIDRARREKSMLCIVFFDINRFKIINDQYGHQTGDRVIQEVGKRLKRIARKSDILARYGGDEFVIGFPQTNIQKANYIISRMKEHIEGKRIEQLLIKISHGMAVYPESGKNLEELIKVADERMYRFKGFINEVYGQENKLRVFQ